MKNSTDPIEGRASTLRTVEQSPGETTVVLRAGGWSRWIDVAILLVKLGVWFIFEGLLLNPFLSSTSIAWRIPGLLSDRKEAPPPQSIAVLLLIFAVLVTAVGFQLLTTLLRVLIGRDRIVLMREGLRSRRGIGSFGRERTFRAVDVESISIERSARVLCLRVRSREIVLASLGTEEDRRWVAAAMQKQYGLKTPSERMEGEVPDDWEVDVAVDDSVRLRGARKGRRSLIGCLGLGSGVWWLLVAASVFRRFIVTGTVALTFADAVRVGIGLLLIVMTYWTSQARVTMRVRPNELIRETAFGLWKHRELFADGALRVAHDQDSRMNDRFALEARQGARWKKLASGTNQSGPVLGLARYLAKQTGWDLEVAPQAREI
jgi:hypothetical protein